MRLAIIGLLILVLTAVSAQVYFIFKERNELKADISVLNSRIESLTKENAGLRSDIEYFSHPENLQKELKSKFNYKLPDEKMLIVVP